MRFWRGVSKQRPELTAWETALHIGIMIRAGGIVLAISILALGNAALASELKSFNRQVADAYAPYRSAMFYLRTGNPGIALLELEAASKHWQAIVDRFAAVPPDAFVDDPNFADTLKTVQDAFVQGIEALGSDDRETATTSLARIRTDLSELRRRSGIRIYGDCIDDMNAAMDRLWVYRHEPPAFDQADQINAVKRDAAITDFLYRRCYETAPEDLQKRDTFKRLFEGSLVSLPLIFDALDRGNEAQLINILRELRSFDRMIWLEFG